MVGLFGFGWFGGFAWLREFGWFGGLGVVTFNGSTYRPITPCPFELVVV